ncbi:DUF4130 domain-containing protein [Anaerostipes caccae]
MRFLIFTQISGKYFFETIGVEARKNPRCQKTMMPLWYRKHMTEFL